MATRSIATSSPGRRTWSEKRSRKDWRAVRRSAVRAAFTQGRSPRTKGRGLSVALRNVRAVGAAGELIEGGDADLGTAAARAEQVPAEREEAAAGSFEA